MEQEEEKENEERRERSKTQPPPPPLGTRNDEINIELPLLSYKLTIMVTVFQI
jgi:hypothetical protein